MNSCKQVHASGSQQAAIADAISSHHRSTHKVGLLCLGMAKVLHEHIDPAFEIGAAAELRAVFDAIRKLQLKSTAAHRRYEVDA